jgi:hypothetical protein
MTPNRILRRTPWLALIASLALSNSIYGQVKYPAPPKEYDVEIRFRLRAPLPGWYDLFDQMLAELKSVGFQRNARPAEEPEDPDSDRLYGVIASQNSRKLLLHPNVQTILLVPRGWKAPTDADKRVKVNLDLATGLAPDRQHVLSDQVIQQLDQIGFREAIGYDHRGYTRIFGTIDAFHLGNLVRDLRTEPAGWLLPQTAIRNLPTPIRNVVPIRAVEVLPEPNDIAPVQEPPPAEVFPEGQTHLAKITSTLRASAANEKDDQKRTRVEVVLAYAPKDFDRGWERELRTAALGSAIEGRLGNVVTVSLPTQRIPDLARPAAVAAVRVPISGEEQRRPAHGEAIDALAESHLNRFHQMGYRGAGIKVAIIAGDFGGWEKLVGNRLPKDTRLVDFTTARNPSLLPDPMPSSDGPLGQGTLCALAVRAAAPEAPLVLVRVDPAAPYQLLTIAKMINGDFYSMDVLEQRRRELEHDRDVLDRRRQDLQDERRKALENLTFEQGESRLPELRKRYEESQARLKRVQADLESLKKDEAELQLRVRRFLAIGSDLTALNGVRVAVSPLAWNEGHPIDGGSELSRYFDDRPFTGYPGDHPEAKIAGLRPNRNTLWVQAAGDSRGQTWAGMLRDDDGNGVMEFAPPAEPPRTDRWTAELNFLGWQTFDGKSAPDLPEKARLRVSIQWREPHDPALSNEADDLYREPIANLGLVVLRQRDPSGTRLATDDLEVIARTTAPGIRLSQGPTSGVYEQSVEFEAVAGGRLALRVEGRVPEQLRPAGSAVLASQRKRFEILPRIYIEILDEASRFKGRAVFLDYPGGADWPAGSMMISGRPQFGGVGMPADARNVLSVGAAGRDGRATYYSAVGAGPDRELLIKPDLLGFTPFTVDGRVAEGSAFAAAFNAGVAACLLGSGAPAQPYYFMQLLQLSPGTALRLPEAWMTAAQRK